MGKSGTLGGINRKRTSIVKKRNKSLKLNRKNKVEKQEQAPQFTSKTLWVSFQTLPHIAQCLAQVQISSQYFLFSYRQAYTVEPKGFFAKCGKRDMAFLSHVINAWLHDQPQFQEEGSFAVKANIDARIQRFTCKTEASEGKTWNVSGDRRCRGARQDAELNCPSLRPIAFDRSRHACKQQIRRSFEAWRIPPDFLLRCIQDVAFVYILALGSLSYNLNFTFDSSSWTRVLSAHGLTYTTGPQKGTMT